ncbi:putative sporulation protein YtxC [uncultured Metabacillus sp.]|uniref:putative sporulation protein YtxC n=1 Tax=uncultured Metabacillus sp. TaxID=2860135 RepID=UPI00262E5397|nr:putative sporulation protein YtxC [uncultured Metabacillus sp.]
MLEILFGSPKEANIIFSIFRTLCKDFETDLQMINQQCIKITPKTWENSLENLVIPGLVQFIIDHKEHQMMLTILKEHYFFLEEEEQQQIIHIAQSIIEGERKDIPGVQSFFSRDVILRDSLQEFLRPDLFFSFSSFQKFRLHEYTARLREYVEAAIEEYKLEQEYQNFIQSLRDFLVHCDSKLEFLSIVQDKEFLVYNAENLKVTEDELQAYIDQAFVSQHPMYIDSKLLAPIVSIAPKWIYLYTNDPFDGMVQTIQNVFQERVTIHSLSDFKQKSTNEKNV